MLRKIKFCIVIIYVYSINIYSQTYINTPFSFYGIGILEKGFGQNMALGYTGVGLRIPNIINPDNPAAYNSQDTMSFLFDVGLHAMENNIKYEDQSWKTNNFNISHIALSFPITKWWYSAISLKPYSRINYAFRDEYTDKWDDEPIYYLFEGIGGLNQFNFGHALNLFNLVSLGFNASYLFGTINQNKYVYFPYSNYVFQTKTENLSTIGGIYLNYGIQFYKTFTDNYSLVLGCIFEDESNITMRNTFYAENRLQSFGLRDTLAFIKDEKGTLKLPRKLGLGFSFKAYQKFLLTADYHTGYWSDVSVSNEDEYMNTRTVNFGFEYIPNAKSIDKYFKHFRYRIGGYTHDSYIQIGNEQVKEYGITWGIGIPMKKSKTIFNLAFELGKRGIENNINMEESFGKVSININMYDIWFYKRKFD